ncbi:MAG: hypothetical protein IPK76_08770 [Lewinellaceae bacterium]|jgi:hypothetical protein|nr:hypothetical protein [Lewinellaceae bacterium]
MRFLLPFLMLVVMAGSFIVGMFYLIARVLGQLNLDPESQAWKTTVERLRTRLMAQAAGALVPWDHEMLSLLSLNQKSVKKPGFFNSSTSEGVFTTIYQEPVLAYAAQKKGETSVLIARTSDRELTFRTRGKETEIWVGGQPFGIFVDGALISAGRNNRLLAKMEADAGDRQFPVLIGDSTAAAIANPGMADSAGPNPRALTMLREISKDEENALLALAVMQMTREG